MTKTKHISRLSVFALFFALVTWTQAQTAVSSGEWDDTLIWDSYSVPTDNEPAFIPDDYIITKTDAGTSNARIKAGSNAAGGTLIISAGRINASNSMIGVHEIALEEFGSGMILIDGGELSTSSNNGGGIQVGVGDSSNGHLRISSGAITTTGGIHLGLGANALGEMTISGGTVTVATGTGRNMNINRNPNFFVGGLVRSVHERRGVFNQTGGAFTLTDGFDGTYYYFSVGNSRVSANTPVGNATITGGSFTSNVKVGRDADVGVSGGTGLLSIGPEADVKGQSQAWEISGNGILQFRLGSDDSFNPVDLTTVSSPEAIVFSQDGARIQVDGSALAFSSLYRSMTLLEYQRGRGPSAASLGNLSVEFTGFDSRFNPRVEWTDTAFVLIPVR